MSWTFSIVLTNISMLLASRDFSIYDTVLLHGEHIENKQFSFSVFSFSCILLLIKIKSPELLNHPVILEIYFTPYCTYNT